MVDRVSHLLNLENRAEVRECPQRLQISGPRWKVLAGLDVRRRVEAPEASESRPLRANVSGFEKHVPWSFVLNTRRPLLHVGRTRVLVNAVVTRETRGGRLRKSILQSKYRSKSVRLI